MNRMKTYLLLAALTSLLLVAGQAMGGRSGLLLALTFAVVMNVGSYWFSDTIVLRMHNAQEIGPNDSPEIFSMVQRLAQRAQLPMPKVYIIPDDSPNAFATGRSPHRPPRHAHHDRLGHHRRRALRPRQYGHVGRNLRRRPFP